MLTNQEHKPKRRKPAQLDILGLRDISLDDCARSAPEGDLEGLPLFEHAKSVLDAQEEKRQEKLI